MAAQTELDIASTELEKVRTDVPALFYRTDTFYGNLKKSTSAEIVSNRTARIPLQLEPGGKFGHWNPAGGSLGLGSGSKFKHAEISIEHLRIAFEYQTLAEWSSNTKRKAVVNAVRKQVAEAMTEFRHNCDNICLGDGTGRIGTVSAASQVGAGAGGGLPAHTLVTCNNPVDGNGIKLIRIGQDVQVYAANGTTIRGNTNADNLATVVKYDEENRQVGLSPQLTNVIPVSGDKIVVSGLNESGGSLGAVPNSILGLKYQHSSSSIGNWQGLPRNQYPQVRANRVNANGALSLAHARLAVNKVGDRYGIAARKMKGVKAYLHPAQQQAYEAMGQLSILINKEAKAQGLDMYFNDSMQLAGVPIMPHFSWDRRRIDFVDFSVWGRVEMKKPDFYTVEGRKLFERRASTGAVMASQMFYIVASFNTFTDNPIRLSYIDGLDVPSGY